MDSLEQELLQDAEDDARTVEFIKNYLPQEVKDKFTDEELYYFLDVIVEYYANSGILDAAPDKDGYIEIDQDKIVDSSSVRPVKTRWATLWLKISCGWSRASWNTGNLSARRINPDL